MSSQSIHHVRQGQRSGETTPVTGGDAKGTQSESEPELESEPADTKTLSKNHAFDVLRNSRRRTVISCLRSRGGEMSVKDLSTRVAAEEYDVSVSAVSSAEYKRVYTGLYQCHLPRMEELGVISFDTDKNVVTLCEVAAQLEPYLDEDRSLVSPRVEFGVSAVLALLITAGAMGIGSVGTVPVLLFAALTVVVLIALAFVPVGERTVRPS